MKINFKSEDQYWPYSTALMVEMHGKARQVAEKKWGIMSKGMRLPYSIDTAVDMVNDGAFDKVRKVNVRKEGRYWNVIGVTF